MRVQNIISQCALSFVIFAQCFTVAAAESKTSPTVLTVIGDVKTANRPAINSFRDGFFKFHDKDFKAAYAFTYQDLADLQQVTISAQAKSWPKAITASGPLLSDVLAHAGVEPTATLAFMALDGYAAELTPKERDAKDWILAIQMNGTPLGIGGRGPAWLLYDTQHQPAGPDAESKWVWSVFVIEAQ